MSTDEIAAARALQTIGKDFGQIAHMLGVHINKIRAVLDQPYMEMCRMNITKMREREMRLAIRRQRFMRASEDTRDMTAIFFGDPPHERSALYQKQHGKT